jgi:glucose-1-phosphate adenylyltransferase
MRAFVHPFIGYWEDVGTIGAFFDAHMEMCGPTPAFNVFEPGRPIFTHPRFLPPAKQAEGCGANACMISDGSIIRRAKLEKCVIGVRSVVGEGSTLNEVIMMGQDAFETDEEREMNAGLPARGIGAGCQVSRAIIDKNARIGDGVVITSHMNKPNEDGDCYYVRDGVVVIPKNAIVPDGRRI